MSTVPLPPLSFFHLPRSVHTLPTLDSVSYSETSGVRRIQDRMFFLKIKALQLIQYFVYISILLSI